MDARALARRLRAELGAWSGAHRRARARLDGRSAAVLMYHRVLPRERAEALAVEPGMFVTPDTFARHLDWLVAGFRVLPLHEIVAALAAGRSLPVGACAITFDDGWRDGHDFAFPELLRRGLPVTIFLVTERVGSQGAFWPDDVCRRIRPLARGARRELAAALGLGVSSLEPSGFVGALKPLGEDARARALGALRAQTPAPGPAERELLDWAEVERLAAAGADFESHGASHAILTGLADDAIQRELTTARERLQEHGLGRWKLLAYPSGAFDARVREHAARAGHRAAVGTTRGLACVGNDLLALPRIGLHEDVSRSAAEFHRLVPGTR